MEEKVQNAKKNKIWLICLVTLIIAIAVIVAGVLLLRPSYKKQIKSFAEAMSNDEKMDKFVEKNVDLRALYALEQMEKNEDLDLDDEKALEDAFKKEYKNAKKADYEDSEYVDGVKSLYKMMSYLTSTSDNVQIKVKDIGKLEKTEKLKMFKKANFNLEVTVGGNKQEMKLYGIFYKNKLVLIGADSGSIPGII